MADQDKNKDSDRPRPRFSPFSPFPYGSPLAKVNNLQTSFSGSPGQKMLLGTSLHQSSSAPEREVMTPRMKGREMYGGPVIFGSSARKSRLLSTGPYTATFRSRAVDKAARLERVNTVTFPPSLGAGPPPSSLPSTAPSSPHSSPGPASSPPAPLSSSARVILSTLEKLSSGGTPITDAKRMPLASPSSSTRAEKRKLLETELNCSLGSSPSRKARLGGGGLALSLAGPPLRKNFSPSLNVSSSASSSASSNSMTPQAPRSLPRLVTENQSGPETKVSTDNAIVNSTKSSLKMKSKVTDSGRAKVDLTSSAPPCPPAPPSSSLSSTQLKVDSLPVFNFGNAIKSQAPVTSSSSKSELTTSKKVSPLPSPIPKEVLERNNNNKSPLKRQSETEGEIERNSPKKIKSPALQSPLAVPKSTPKLGSIPSLTAASSASLTSKSFIFSAPKSVIAETKSQDTSAATKKYSFSLPSPVNFPPKSNEKLSNGTISRVPSATSSVPSFNFKTSTVTPVESVIGGKKMMPDITNNTLRKNNSSDKLKGSNSNSGLPDVTASTGFSGFLPAKELKTGSVMDILGLHKSGF